MPRGVYERKPKNAKATAALKEEAKKPTRKRRMAKHKEPEVLLVAKEPVKKEWYKPLDLPDNVVYVDVKDIPKDVRYSASKFEWNNAVSFIKMMNTKYGVTKFTKPEQNKNSMWVFYYESK